MPAYTQQVSSLAICDSFSHGVTGSKSDEVIQEKRFTMDKPFGLRYRIVKLRLWKRMCKPKTDVLTD